MTQYQDAQAPMTQQENTLHLRIWVYWIAAAAMLLMSLSALFTANYLTALLALAFCLLLAANAWRSQHSDTDEPARPHLVNHLIAGFLGLSTLASLIFIPNQVEEWCYLFPLVVFSIYRLRLATTLTAIYAVLVMFSLMQFYAQPQKVQIFFTFLFCLALTLAFVYLREIREQQLKPLRRTDTLTLASTREYLSQDLTKEIQRSEREGTDLSVLALAIDPAVLAQYPHTELDNLLNRLGRILHENLRLFDSYYRYGEAEFVIILPHTNTKNAMTTAEKLRVQCKKQLGTEQQPVTVSIGVVGLNVGDDSESLIRMAHQALSVAQARGSNQTCSHVDLAPNEDGNHD